MFFMTKVIFQGDLFEFKFCQNNNIPQQIKCGNLKYPAINIQKERNKNEFERGMFTKIFTKS